MSFPLFFLVDRGALIASKVNGEDMVGVMGAVNQLWIPGMPANYFLRDIERIDFAKEAVEPPAPSLEFDEDINRPNISVSGEYVVQEGNPIVFKGWASDFDCVISAVELSLDDGATWVECACPGATYDRLLYWTFTCEPLEAGMYRLQVRARNELGIMSPVPATHCFEVMPAA